MGLWRLFWWAHHSLLIRCPESIVSDLKRGQTEIVQRESVSWFATVAGTLTAIDFHALQLAIVEVSIQPTPHKQYVSCERVSVGTYFAVDARRATFCPL